ncbi:MAG: tRNA glutamyl-Q(34) synthetase GluQRS [Gammaproteobacteria bacterium]
MSEFSRKHPTASPPSGYRGRFAPSPTGPLHFGSLITALASFLEARSHGGEWLVRVEDLDPPREQPGADRDILRTLEAFDLTWDGPVLYQSSRKDAYEEALDRLLTTGTAYPCACTRRDIAAHGRIGLEGPVYPGTCRGGLPPGAEARSVRVRTDTNPTAFEDAVQGHVRQILEHDVGDFIIRRADGLIAYQLACVVDDAYQGITEVVRGSDLLISTPRQIHLYRQLGHTLPRFCHLPVAINAEGQKLSKLTGAPAVQTDKPGSALVAALTFLGQGPPQELERARAAEILDWARSHWDAARIPRRLESPAAAAFRRRGKMY